MITIENKCLYRFRNEEKIGFYETVKSYVSQIRQPEFIEIFDSFSQKIDDYNKGKILYFGQNCNSKKSIAHQERISAFKNFKNYVCNIKSLGEIQLGIISRESFEAASKIALELEDTKKIEYISQSTVTGKISIILEQLNNSILDIKAIKAENLYQELVDSQQKFIDCKHNYSKEKLEIPTGILTDLISKINQEYRKICNYLEAYLIIKNDETILDTIIKINHLVKTSKIS